MQKHRSVKKFLIALAVLLVLTVAGLVLVGNFFYNFALNPNSPITFGSAEPMQPPGTGKPGLPNPYVTADPRGWIAENTADRFLESRDGLRLHAYCASLSQSHKYVVICHGYMSQARLMGAPASHFYGLGYNVLLPDARGHGQSEGDYIGMGWHERLDILDWISTLVAADPEAQIVLYGISMGAATVMMVSGEELLPANVSCVVEDCGYTSAWAEFAEQLNALYKLPAFPILNVTSLVTKVRAGYFFGEASAVAQVAKSHTPTLFIHGDADTFVPFRMLDEVYRAAACEKEKLVVPGAKHAAASSTNPTLYWTAVDAFLEKHAK
ncbi:MAG: alpha/beta hydrolase [Pseudoflavonifractor sp.]